MKIAIKFSSLVLLLILTATFANAQRGDWNTDPTERAKQQTTEMTEKLSLSIKQAEKVGEINLKYADKMKEAREGNKDGDWTAMRETMMKMRQEQNAEFKNVMTTAQFEQWEKVQAEQRSQRQGRGDRDGERGKVKKTQEKQE